MREEQLLVKVEVLECHVWVVTLLFRRVTAERRALEIVLLVDREGLGQQVVEDDQSDAPVRGRRDADQTEEAREERVLRAHHVIVVVGQDLAKELGLHLRDRLDEELAVLGQVEDRAALARRAQLAQGALAADGDEIIVGLDAKVLSQMPEGKGRVVVEGEMLG